MVLQVTLHLPLEHYVCQLIKTAFFVKGLNIHQTNKVNTVN